MTLEVNADLSIEHCGASSSLSFTAGNQLEVEALLIDALQLIRYRL
jgi:hypothetical protein